MWSSGVFFLKIFTISIFVCFVLGGLWCIGRVPVQLLATLILSFASLVTHQSVTKCSSNPSKIFISLSEISNPSTLAFSIIRFCLVLLGKVMKSCWRPHLDAVSTTTVVRFSGTLLDKNLSWCDGVFLCHVQDGRVIHAFGTGKRSIGLNDYVVLGTGSSDVLLSVERMNLDLVDHRRNTWVGCHQLFDLG